MRKLKQWLALGLCGALMLTGVACGAGGDGSGSDSSGSGGGGGSSNTPVQNTGAKGRYVETDITPPGAQDEALASFTTADGRLVCYTRDLTKRFESADGGDTWEETPGPNTDGSLGDVQNLALLPDGTLLGSVWREDGQGVESLVKIAPDGTVTPFEVPKLQETLDSGDTTYINMLQVVADNRLLLGYSAGDFGAAVRQDGDEPADGSDAPEADGSTPEGPDASVPDDAGDPGSLPAGEDDPGDSSSTDGDDDAPSGSFQGFSMGDQTHFAGLIDLATGELVAEFSEWQGFSATSGGGVLYLLDYSGEILAKSLEDGQALSGETQVPVGEFIFNAALAVGADGNLYAMDGRRIYKMAPGGEAETLMEGGSYAFGGASTVAQALHLLQNSDLVLNLMQNGSSRLYRYHYDENATLDESQILRVWSLNESYLVRAAISALRRQNPDLVVEYEVALTEGGNLTAEDAIKNLNTRLLNGDGPDVVMLDGCPADSYAKRGMLADLTALLNTSGVFTNLLEPFKSDSGLHYLPMNFKVPLLLGTADNLKDATSLEQLAALVQNGNDLPAMGPTEDVFAQKPESERPVLSPADLEELFNILWNTGAGSVVGENGLDSDALRTLLAALQTISDKYELTKDGGNAGGAMAVMGSDGGAAATVQGGVLAYASGRALLGSYLADDMQMLQMMTEPEGTQTASFPGLEQNSYVPVSLAGISADSQKMDLAAQFLQAMLGDDVQGTRTGAGFPVTESGMQKQIADIDKLMRENRGMGFEFDYSPLIALAQNPQRADEVVTNMVWAVAQSLCAGETDLEGAVKQLEQDLKNYLAERQ